MEYTHTILIATVVSFISFRSGVGRGILAERMHYEDGASEEVALESLVVCAVRYEPVSTSEFPDKGRFTGNFRQKLPVPAIRA
jgi:hypothetical protein